MGSSSRSKGGRGEREVVRLFQSHLGLDAYRGPLSGSQRGFRGDVLVPALFGDRPIEVKRGRHVPKRPGAWLGDNAALLMRRDRDRWLVVMSFEDFAELIMRVAVEGVGSEGRLD